MATATKTYQFLANAENLADQGNDFNLDVLFNQADGNPVNSGSLEWTQSIGTTGDEHAISTASDTWESLFGISAGSTITNVQIASWDSLTWSTGNISVNGIRTRMRFVSGVTPFAIIHSSGDLIDFSERPTAGGTLTSHGSFPDQPIDFGFQTSNTQIRFEIQVTITATGTISLDYEYDNIVIIATYTAVSLAQRPVEKQAIMRLTRG